jgi:hypothetical protein
MMPARTDTPTAISRIVHIHGSHAGLSVNVTSPARSAAV